jgi:hypothetical protein
MTTDDLARRVPMGYLTTAARNYARAAAGNYLTLDVTAAEFLAYAVSVRFRGVL